MQCFNFRNNLVGLRIFASIYRIFSSTRLEIVNGKVNKKAQIWVSIFSLSCGDFISFIFNSKNYYPKYFGIPFSRCLCFRRSYKTFWAVCTHFMTVRCMSSLVISLWLSPLWTWKTVLYLSIFELVQYTFQ